MRFTVDTDNLVIMWNPLLHEFLNNTCPCNEQDNHGFISFTKKPQCENLGIHCFLLVEGVSKSGKEACVTEQACHYQIDNLDMGWQGLHRVSGAGKPNPVLQSGSEGHRSNLFPPKFLKLHPNVVIVGSAVPGLNIAHGPHLA
jgi:hypothetical protein